MTIQSYGRQAMGTQRFFKTSPSGSDVAFTPASVANGNYWQSAKMDLGATYAQLMHLFGAFLFGTAPTARNPVEVWWNPSTNSTPGTDEKGGCSGTDSAYTGYSSNAADAVNQLLFVGAFSCTVQTTLQVGWISSFIPPTQWGSFVIRNGSGVAMSATTTNVYLQLSPADIVAEI